MFKRLQGLIAICLVLCILTPAVPAEAAAMVINKSSKVLYLNEDNKTGTSDHYDFYIKHKPANYKKKYTFRWYTKNSSIVNVAMGGVVTAKKVGEATVCCDIIKKSTKKVINTVKAKVTVKANAASVTINNPLVADMKIGDTYDFNRTMEAADGKKATDKTEWFSSDENILTIDNVGFATAHAEGEVEIQCKTYQSSATKQLGYTAVSEPIKVKVVNAISDVSCVAIDKIMITTLGSVKLQDLTDANRISVIEKGSSEIYAVKDISVDGVFITATLDKNLKNNKTYDVAVAGMNSKELTASFGKVSSITFTSWSGPANQDTVVDVRLLDENGTDITAICDLTNLSATPVQGTRYIMRDEEGKFHIYNNDAFSSVGFEMKYVILPDDTNKAAETITSTVKYYFTDRMPDQTVAVSYNPIFDT